mgnify:CR=1 FL=1
MKVEENRRLLILALLMIYCIGMVNCAWADHAEFPAGHQKVTLQLKWKHQFQFAGYYAALEQGYYREVGLEVELIERKGGPERPVETVLDGGRQLRH